MKLTTKNDKPNVVGEKNITNEIEKNVEKPEWIIIGGKKRWKRKCNHCGNIILHKSINRLYVSRKHNKKCQKCRQPKGIDNSFYGKKHTKKIKLLYSKHRIGKKNPISILKNFDKRGKAGINGVYHLDHIKSVWYGFKNQISSDIISDIKNLRFIPWLENQKKWFK